MADKVVTLADLHQDPENARSHNPRNLRTVVDALHEVGAARSGVIDEDGRILAGNLTWEALAEAGIERVRVVETDGKEWVVVRRAGLTEEQKKRLAYFDNRSAELASWDVEQVLADVETGFDIDGLWSDEELGDLLAAVGDFGQPDSLEEVPSELPGAMALKDDMRFKSDLPWDIPALLPNMLSPLPTPLDTWAGSDVCEDDQVTHWLYNWGSDSIKGLPLDRTLLAFYVDDARFENFWYSPSAYVSKVLNAGIPLAVAPNFSLWANVARATHLYNVYRSRWVARYMQEAGLRVIPDVNWADEQSFEFCLLGIPEGLPAIAVQLQTVKTDGERQRAVTGLALALDRLHPHQLLVYSGPTGPEVVEQVGPQCEVVFVANRVAKRRSKIEHREVMR